MSKISVIVPCFNEEAVLPKLFTRLGVELLIHTAGPFKSQDNGVAEDAARARSHYIDLAEGRR